MTITQDCLVHEAVWIKRWDGLARVIAERPCPVCEAEAATRA